MIRIACADDLDAVEQGYLALFAHEREHGTTTNWSEGLYPTRDTAAQALATGTLFVLENDGDVCASMILNHFQMPEYAGGQWACAAEDGQALVVHTLCVRPDCAGRGYGGQMVRFAAERARALGCRCVRLDTWAGNQPARRLYEKLGFRYAGTVDALLQGVIPEQQALFELCLDG